MKTKEYYQRPRSEEIGISVAAAILEESYGGGLENPFIDDNWDF